MNCATARTTIAVAAAALLATPIVSRAQQPTPSPRASSSMSRPAAGDAQKGSAQEHLREAKSTLNEIPAASFTGTAKTRVTELKRHISTLEQSAAAPQPNTSAQRGKAAWTTEVAAADRILTELLGPTATGATEPAAKDAAVTLDANARAKLEEVRTHLTAFAAAMSGSSSSPAPSSDDPSASASASAAAPPPAAASAAASPATPTNASAPASNPAQPAGEPPAAQPAASPAASASPQQADTASPQQADTQSVRRHLTAARDTLSQLTQLPAAAQLTGDARTQVSQLISNFNELITTNTEWRASYTKVQTNLNALVGDQRADESPAPAAGAAGAVGTSGTVALDPAIRAKLVEFRTHLMEFEKAAGGGSAGSPSAEPSPTPGAQPSEPAAAPSSPAAAQPSEPTAAPASPPAAPPSEPAAPPATSAASTPAPSPSPSPTAGATGTAGSSATPAATAGTTGSNPAPRSEERPDERREERGEDQQAAKPATSGSQQATQQHAEAMRHIEAIEAILNGTSAAGTTGSSAKSKPSAPATLDRAQIEQIRTHLAELRRSLSQAPQK